MNKRLEKLKEQIENDFKAYNVKTRLADEQGIKALQQDLQMMLDKWNYKYGFDLEPIVIRQISKTQFNMDIMSAFRKYPKVMQQKIACELAGIDMSDVALFDWSGSDGEYITGIIQMPVGRIKELKLEIPVD